MCARIDLPRIRGRRVPAVRIDDGEVAVAALKDTEMQMRRAAASGIAGEADDRPGSDHVTLRYRDTREVTINRNQLDAVGREVPQLHIDRLHAAAQRRAIRRRLDACTCGDGSVGPPEQPIAKVHATPISRRNIPPPDFGTALLAWS